MPTTLNLQNSMNFVAPILKNQKLQVSNQEPALTAANIVLGTMVGPPMKWPFNRDEINFPVTAGGGTDYLVSVPEYGFIETQWVVDADGKYFPMNGAVSLPVNGDQGRPEKLAPQFDNNAGGITFRLDKKPDKNYTVYCDFQKKAPLLTSAASEWSPVPDQFNYIFNYGFLCLMSLLVNDSRFTTFEGLFVARLLGAQDGLTDQERNIFLGNFAAALATVSRSQGGVASGQAARSR